MIYFDYAATTPMKKSVLEAYNVAVEQFYGNASSLHDTGTKAAAALEKCKESMAHFINGKQDGIYFTSSGSEANMLAILSILEGNKERGNHIITTEVEHASLFNVFQYLETVGYDVTYLPIDEEGQINIDHLQHSIKESTVLASIHHGNSEIGSVQNIKAIGQMLARHDVIFHTDCVQTFGKRSIDVEKMQIDSLSISAHKIYGPKGIGLCYVNPRISWESKIKNITQQSGFKAGTEDVPSIIAMTQAAKVVLESKWQVEETYEKWRKQLIKSFHKMELPISIIGSSKEVLSNIVGMTFPGVQGQHIMLEYNQYGIAVSTGSACQVGQQSPSRTMLSMGKSVDEAKQFIRISFGAFTTEKDIARLIDVTKRIIAEI